MNPLRMTAPLLLLVTLISIPAPAASRLGSPQAAVPDPALGAADPMVSAHLNVSALQPSKQAVVAVVLDVPDHLHAQSNTPRDKNLVKTEVVLDANPAFTASAPIYPTGKDVKYPALGTLNVYTGRAVIYVPIQVKADASLGEAKISGTLTYQVCNDQTCFPPADAPFTISTKVVAAGTEVTPVQPDLFKDYKPSSQAAIAPSNANTSATTKPASATAAGAETGAPPVIVEDVSPKWGVPLALGIAFVAGVLFNIVPCVLPVLPIKVLGFAEVAQHDRGKTVVLASVFGLGIVTVFAVLSVLILVLKKISWGEQFANPIFAWGVVIVLLGLSLWMFGIFEVNLPTSAYAITPRHDTMIGNYQWGILTAVLSTPCTGPMFGQVMAWAQQQPAGLGVSAMMTVGVGMAAPYILLSAFPETARNFPRVGPWSELFKQMLGFILLGFTAFFAAGRFTTSAGQWWAVVPVAGVAALYLMARTVQLSTNARPVAISSVLAVSMVTASVLTACRFSGVFDHAPGAGGSTASAGSVNWVPYSDDALASARAANKIVLVKFTANWCLNCQYVEATVYHDGRAIGSLRQHDVVTLKADLTQKNAAGWPLLRELLPGGGIPLTAIYAPGYAKPVQITSIYTTDTLVKALDQLDPRPATASAVTR